MRMLTVQRVLVYEERLLKQSEQLACMHSIEEESEALKAAAKDHTNSSDRGRVVELEVRAHTLIA
jgi:hypothetical protein